MVDRFPPVQQFSPRESRLQERNALLNRIKILLRDDPRVAAAWMWGSLCRGDADEWSDLDLWVVYYDEEYCDRSLWEIVRQTDHLFAVTGPQNAPPGGAYLMSAHQAETGPHLADWYIQPLSFARYYDSAQMLVDRECIVDGPAPDWDRPAFTPDPDDDAENKAALFWAMALIQAKRIARDPEKPDMEFLDFIVSLLEGVATWRGIKLEDVNKPIQSTATEKLSLLSDLGRKMWEVAPAFSSPRKQFEKLLRTVEESIENV